MSFQAKAIYMHGSDSNRSNREIQQYNYFCTVLLGKLRVGLMYVVLTLFPGHHSAFLLLARGTTLVQYCTVFSSEIKLRTVCMNFMCT